MQQTDSTYNSLLAAGAHKQVRARIHINPKSTAASAYDTYDQDRIVSAITQAQMLDQNISIGGTFVKQLKLVLTDLAGRRTIPRMAEIIMEFRLYQDEDHYSDWYPKGVYYIDTRDESYEGVLTINAFDPMLKSEQPFTKPGEQGQWPRPDIRAVSDTREPDGVVNTIAAAMGVEIDQRTFAIMNKGYQINYPGIVLDNDTPQYSQDGAMSMRQILGYIGAMYGGNWLVTDENKLRLIVLGDIPVLTNYLITQNNDTITMGGYRLLVG